ncbi:MAG TPA: DEAD/DEAH box helicase, partial [Nakamurella sp.]
MMQADLHPVVSHHVVNTLQWRTLRPLQQAAVGPVLAGEHCLMIAPTAGGKTEAAILPLLSRAQFESWSGLSVLYVCPLRALLNNLEPRLDRYARWLGRRARVWHGDTTAATRRSILSDPPDILLTTPESLEAMLVSARFDPHTVLESVRAVVVDEIHAFAGDDRGVHLRSLLGRLERLAGHPIQRIGLSATVGNPDELLQWLQGSAVGVGRVIAPDSPADRMDPGARPLVADADVAVDYVGTLDNAAIVIAALQHGDKKLIFVDSRRDSERLATAISALGVTAFVSHSSLSSPERHRTETAFAESTNCVIVA